MSFWKLAVRMYLRYTYNLVKVMRLKSMKGKISKISSLTQYLFFHSIKFKEKKNIFIKEIKKGNVYIFFLRSTSKGTPRTIFRRYYRGVFMSVAMQNPNRLPIFSPIYRFILHSIEWTLFVPWCIYKLRMI